MAKQNQEELDIEALERFIYKNDELATLESLSNKFNVFNALKISNREIRHSIFLAWLLDPLESHNLGDRIISELIQTINYISKSQGSKSISIFEADSCSFEDIEVRREWKNIDLLLIDNNRSRFWLIENKIYSGEHSNQLKRYKEIANREFSNYEGFYFYLTIDGYYSSDDDYVPISYSLISEVIEKVILNSNGYIDNDVKLFVRHYNDMLKTQIMEESEIQKICKDIYKKHKHALDLIYQYKPDELMNIKEILVDYINRNIDLILEDTNKAYIRFIPKAMDIIPKAGEAWLKSNRILVFELRNYSSGLKLNLLIGPGDDVVRDKLYDFMYGRTKVYNRSNKKLSKKWFSVFSKDVLSAKDREDMDDMELEKVIKERMDRLINNDVSRIIEDIQKINIKSEN